MQKFKLLNCDEILVIEGIEEDMIFYHMNEVWKVK